MRTQPGLDERHQENIAEIALLVGADYDSAIETHDSSDDIRTAVLQAAEIVTKYEYDNDSVWERYDWRIACDAIAAAICKGDSPDLAAILKAQDVHEAAQRLGHGQVENEED